MDMKLVRSCPKCGGNIYRYFSRYDGWHEECFNCGYRVLPEGTPGAALKETAAGAKS